MFWGYWFPKTEVLNTYIYIYIYKKRNRREKQEVPII